MFRPSRSSPVPPACSTVPGLQLSAGERPAAFSMLKTRAASSGTRDAWGLVRGSRRGASSRPCLGDRCCLLAMWPHHPRTGWDYTRGTSRLPIPPTRASLFSVRVALVPGVVLPLLPASLAAQILVLSSAECSCCLDSARHIKTLTQAPFQLNELNAWGCRDESSSKGRPCASLRCFKDSLWQMLTGKDRSAGMAGK